MQKGKHKQGTYFQAFKTILVLNFLYNLQVEYLQKIIQT